MNEVWSVERVMALRDTLRAKAKTSDSQRDESLHQRAALLTSFLIDDMVAGQQALANLIDDSIPIDPADKARRTLKHQVRVRTLARFDNKADLVRALVSIQKRPTDLTQRMFESWLRNELKPLEAQTSRELTATLQIVDWFSGSVLATELPAPEDVRIRVGLAALFDPLRSLVGPHFRGRRLELGVLNDHLANGKGRPPLLVYGPGGMGKSTLAASLILNALGHAAVAYLDCDRPGLIPERPVTLLAEAVRQLGLQFPSRRTAGERLRTRWLEEIAQPRQETSVDTPTAVVAGARQAEEFRVFVGDLALGERPLLVVIDTFEEVQYRSQAAVREVFDLLGKLRKLVPELRIVVAGRNAIPRLEFLSLELRELDAEAATAILEANGVSSANLRARLARLLRGNPLSLQLAAEAFTRSDGATEVDDLQGLVDDTAIQGVLYGRILGHIHDGDVKKIAHPGLILRYVDADIIRRVLAEPCGLPLPDEVGAADLLARLGQELSLVVPEGDGVRHRPDVRRVMLPALKKDQRAKVRLIEQAAVQYFSNREDDLSRAEEVYHRLSLGESSSTIEPLWRSGIAATLHSAVDDLEGESRAYLASKLGIELYDESWENVDQITWERYAGRQADDLLKIDRPLEALQLLRRRSSRLPASALFWYHAQASYRTGNRLEAREAARQGLESLLGNAAWANVTGDPERGRLVDWFVGPTCASPPSKDEAWRQVGLAELLAPLRTLASRTFAGRDREFAALEGFVGRGPNPKSQVPLLVHGPGGAGKSTLVAKFAVERIDRLALVYVDCEELASGNWSLVERVFGEARRQLGLQFDGVAAATQKDSELPMWEQATRLISMIESLPLGDRLLLFVLDGFEFAAIGSTNHAAALTRTADLLCKRVPRVRAILIGRHTSADIPVELLSVGRLDVTSAQAFLAAEGIEPQALRTQVIDLMGGNPFALRLMADLIRKDGPEAVLGAAGSGGDVTAYVYKRVLANIPDTDVREATVTALVLRRVTPELLAWVLQQATEFRLEDPVERAEVAFSALRREASIFTSDGDALVPRTDIRRSLLPSLERGRPELVRAVREAAIQFYASRSDADSRAEEIYQRLALGQNPKEIDRLWEPGISPKLYSAFEELHGNARAYLAARLGLEAAEIDWTRTDQSTWERYVAKRAVVLARTGQYGESVELLRQRAERLPHSPLYELEADALLRAKQPRDALLVAQRGLRGDPDNPRLKEIVGACRAELGNEESPATAPPTSIVHVRSGLTEEAIVAALGDALPTATDVLVAFADLKQVVPVQHSSLASIVASARRIDRVDDLVRAASAYAPSSSALRDLLVSSGDANADLDPYARVWLGNRPFFARDTLRDFMRNLLRDERYRVLAVSGPAGTGKTYTRELAAHLAQLAQIDFAYCEIGPEIRVLTIIQQLFAVFGWRLEEELAPSSHPARESDRWAQQLASRVQRHSRKLLILFDVQEEIDHLVHEFLFALAGDPKGPHMILAGLHAQQLSAHARPDRMQEWLEPLTAVELEIGTRRIEIELGLQKGALEPVNREAAIALADGASANNQLNRLVRDAVNVLLDGRR